MTRIVRCLTPALAAAVLLSAGCGNEVKPVGAPYSFMGADRSMARQYHYGGLGNPHKLTGCLTAPKGYQINFEGSLKRPVGDGAEPLLFTNGLYPFQLCCAGKANLCGAMMVVNVDETIEMATFGKSPETKLFSEELLTKAGEGVLSTYTIAFDKKTVIVYWLGNRLAPSSPGSDTMEFNFAGTDATDIRIDGSSIRDAHCVLDVMGTKYNAAYATLDPVAKSYKLEIARKNGKKYAGYIRDLKPNVYTTFVQLPCAIPAKLFDAADQGTIAKFTVVPEGSKDSPVAEIVFSAR